MCTLEKQLVTFSSTDLSINNQVIIFTPSLLIVDILNIATTCLCEFLVCVRMSVINESTFKYM